jgi:hypothetical protein
MSVVVEPREKVVLVIKCTKCDQEFDPQTKGTIGPFLFLGKVVYVCPNC